MSRRLGGPLDLDVHDINALVAAALMHRPSTAEQAAQRKRWIAALRRCIAEKIRHGVHEAHEVQGGDES